MIVISMLSKLCQDRIQVVFQQLLDCGTMSFRNHTVHLSQNGSSKDRNIDMPFCIN